jgi:hypothetical protein
MERFPEKTVRLVRTDWSRFFSVLAITIMPSSCCNVADCVRATKNGQRSESFEGNMAVVESGRLEKYSFSLMKIQDVGRQPPS